MSARGNVGQTDRERMCEEWEMVLTDWEAAVRAVKSNCHVSTKWHCCINDTLLAVLTACHSTSSVMSSMSLDRPHMTLATVQYVYCVLYCYWDTTSCLWITSVSLRDRQRPSTSFRSNTPVKYHVMHDLLVLKLASSVTHVWQMLDFPRHRQHRSTTSDGCDAQYITYISPAISLTIDLTTALSCTIFKVLSYTDVEQYCHPEIHVRNHSPHPVNSRTTCTLMKSTDPGYLLFLSLTVSKHLSLFTSILHSQLQKKSYTS